jgi:hypothetical protein
VRILTRILAVLVLAASGLSQDTVRNPAKPLNPDSGRVLRLEPIYEIKDDSGEFFFKFPRKFALDSRGSLYVLDVDQLLEFSPEGRFVRNFYKKGQGPGEIGAPYHMVSFLVSGDGLYVYDGRGKIIRLDREGTLIAETKQTAGRFFELLGMCREGFFMRGQSSARWGGGAGFQEVETQIYLLSLDGASAEKIAGFTSRIYQGPGFGMDWDGYKDVLNRRDGTLYVNRTCEYQVEMTDLLNRKSIGSLTRAYPRVPFVIGDREKDFYAKYNPPKKDYANDISELYMCDDNLWVSTSTSDEARGNLFDVFDPKGRYVDSFYLDKNLGLVLAFSDYIIARETDKEGNISIKKFRVLNGPKG